MFISLSIEGLNIGIHQIMSNILMYTIFMTESLSMVFSNNIKFPGLLTCSDNKVRELTAVKLLHTSLLNTTVVAFKLFPLESYAPMPVASPPLKTILEMVLWNGLQSCRCITPDVIIVIKTPSF